MLAKVLLKCQGLALRSARLADERDKWKARCETISAAYRNLRKDGIDDPDIQETMEEIRREKEAAVANDNEVRRLVANVTANTRMSQTLRYISQTFMVKMDPRLSSLRSLFRSGSMLYTIRPSLQERFRRNRGQLVNDSVDVGRTM